MRLIDADKLNEALVRKSDEMYDIGQPSMSGTVMGVIGIVNHQPEINIVRCGRCKYYMEPVIVRDSGICVIKDRNELVDIDGFCSCGKER